MRRPQKSLVASSDARNDLKRVSSSVSPVLTLLLYSADQPGSGLPLTARPPTGGAKRPWKPLTFRQDCQRFWAAPICDESHGCHTVSRVASTSAELVACALRQPAID